MPELTIELVPKPCWYSNMRNAMSRTNWDRLRREVYAEYNHACGICGATGKLECHEIWKYDDVNHIQRLDGFIALCSLCHHVKHIGLAGILGAAGKLDYEQVIEHFKHVNNCDRPTFDNVLDAAWTQWRARSQHTWTTDLGAYKSLVNDPSLSNDVGRVRASTSEAVMSKRNNGDRLNAVKLSPEATTCNSDETHPSTYAEAYWIYAECRVGNYPEHTDRGGKWMLFVPIEQVDDAWDTVRRAVESGELGGLAKVATAQPNPNMRNPRERVICIYTYDAEDCQDVLRVRRALRRLGFTSKMPYKTDEATRSGQYRARGTNRVSIYYE